MINDSTSLEQIYFQLSDGIASGKCNLLGNRPVMVHVWF